MSIKQLQALIFLGKVEGTLENYLKEDQSFDYKVSQNIIKDLAIALKTGEKETQQFVEEMLNKDDNKILFLLARVSFSLFKGIIRTYICTYVCAYNYIFTASCIATYLRMYLFIFMYAYMFKDYCIALCSEK